MARVVTEQDFRKPEYRDAKPEDYEFRDDGSIARKDRWEKGMWDVAMLMGFDSRKGFEIADVVEAVRRLKHRKEGSSTGSEHTA